MLEELACAGLGTEFGRSLRAALDRPWVSCPDVGTLQVARMVRKAAVWAAREREEGG